ncbi:hypothetical protein HHX48_02135 [Salinimonas sp. HHU 13199]|uniref:Uncharacterized protein n=1 Tax=Salinimonas profundi TaxID=2729140 RepID=A0ABR8LE11_9ALTE|nr:hypothetical protein [Salinimonas profundi]MBD3584530.1 hypothetical protein [Salinimonas profundi]
MNESKLKRAEDRAFYLFLVCVALIPCTILFQIFFLQTDWAVLVGSVKAFFIGGTVCLIPGTYAGYRLARLKVKSRTLKAVLVLSLFWFLSVASVYIYTR